MFCLPSCCRFLLLRYIWCHFNNIIVEGGKFSARLNSLLMLESCLKDFSFSFKARDFNFFLSSPPRLLRTISEIFLGFWSFRCCLPGEICLTHISPSFIMHLSSDMESRRKSRVGVHGKFISHRFGDACDRLKEKLLALGLSYSTLWHCPGEISCSDVRKGEQLQAQITFRTLSRCCHGTLHARQ